MAVMANFGLRRSPDATVLPFFTHQILEYLAGLYLLQTGMQAGGRAAVPCFVLGGAILLAATFSGKPLGGGRLPRRMHRVVDVALVAGLAAAPFLFGFSDNSASLVRLEGLAIALAALAWFTNYGAPLGVARDLARGLKRQAPRMAGAYVGRRLTKRRPPGVSAGGDGRDGGDAEGRTR
jgi:hypothetical protein